MNVGQVTITAFLLLLPGVGFIVGVNFADKNVREIVFRNTPAEIGYVVFVSIIIHFLIICLSTALHYKFPSIPAFDAARLYVDYLPLAKTVNTADPKSISVPSLYDTQLTLMLSLGYFLITAVIGFAPGFVLGRTVPRHAPRWRPFFVKHVWMLDLIQRDEDDPVYARVVVKEGFPLPSPSADLAANNIEIPIIIQGVVRDCFFAADGTILYIVFRIFSEVKTNGLNPDALQRLIRQPATAVSDLLVLEGPNIAMARFYRRALPYDEIDQAPEDNDG